MRRHHLHSTHLIVDLDSDSSLPELPPGGLRIRLIYCELCSLTCARMHLFDNLRSCVDLLVDHHILGESRAHAVRQRKSACLRCCVSDVRLLAAVQGI
jgi:hypothetical protein